MITILIHLKSRRESLASGSRSSVASEEVAKSAEALFPHRRGGLGCLDGWMGGELDGLMVGMCLDG